MGLHTAINVKHRSHFWNMNNIFEDLTRVYIYHQIFHDYKKYWVCAKEKNVKIVFVSWLFLCFCIKCLRHGRRLVKKPTVIILCLWWNSFNTGSWINNLLLDNVNSFYTILWFRLLCTILNGDFQLYLIFRCNHWQPLGRNSLSLPHCFQTSILINISLGLAFKAALNYAGSFRF